VAPPHSLQQVRTTNPSVTYTYSGDEELLQAQQNAVTFCRQYNSTPAPARITRSSSGGNNVVFECSPNLPIAPLPQQTLGPNLTYTYRTDQELLEASRNAEAYCANHGSQRVISNITANADGSKTVIFQCV
jgi:hypothetical protein